MGAIDSLPKMGRLPGDLSSFVGRRQEAADVKRLFEATRLVTLTGPGGVGKSRLALHVARELRRSFSDGVWLVELAELRDASLVDHAVVAALELRDQSARAAQTVLTEYLADKRLLLVIDNCEHLLDQCGRLISTLLAAAPGVSILTTSRAALGVTGEHVFSLAPLSVPDPLSMDGNLTSTQFEALALFEQRAAAVLPGFSLNETNEVAVARICRRLDGLPLAIELAAARMRLLSLDQLLERLEDQFRLLTRGDRTGPARHHTLRAAVEWSFELCSEQERTVWAQLSVFDGGFDLEAAESECTDTENVLETVSGLLEKSIITLVNNTEPARYRMLEAVRQFGRERLVEDGQEDLLRRRHQRYYTRLVERAELEWFGPRQADWYRKLQRERTNLWTALDFSLTQPGEQRAGVHLVGALWPYWVGCGLLAEGRTWSTRALSCGLADSEQTKALWVAGWIALLRGEFSPAQNLLKECRRLASKIDDRSAFAYATEFLGALELCTDNPARAVHLLEDATAKHRTLGQQNSITAIGLAWLAFAEYCIGNLDRAESICEQCRRVCESVGEGWASSWGLWPRALVAWAKNDRHHAIVDLQRALKLKRTINDVLGIAFSIETLAWLAVEDGDMRRAARLMGGCDVLWRPIGAPMFGFLTMIHRKENYQAAAKSDLGASLFEELYRSGQQLSGEEIIALALNESLKTSPQPSEANLPELTKREREVAELITQGLSNKEIATKLVISQRTAETHVEHILIKLGFSCRSQVAAWVSDQRSRQVRTR